MPSSPTPTSRSELQQASPPRHEPLVKYPELNFGSQRPTDRASSDKEKEGKRKRLAVAA